MKTLPCTLLFVLLVCTGCGRIGPWSYRTIHGSGTIVTETRAVANFNHVSLSGAGRLAIVQGDEESLTITTDDNLHEHIHSTVSGQQLRIGPNQVSLRPSREIQYVLHLRNLTRLDLSGSLHASTESLTTESVILQISGSGSITIGTLTADHCETHVSGSGKVRLAGEAVSQKLRVSGSGEYQASNLRSQRVDIRISGSGDATVWVTDQLDTSLSGSGSISYYGSPKTSQSISGSGRVRSLGPKPW